MSQTVKITDLLDPTKFDQYKDQLAGYFEKGGTWKELLKYDDNLLEAQYQKAYDLFQKSDYHNSSAAFYYLTVLNPYDYKLWMGLGISKQAEKLYEEALVSFTGAEAMDVHNPIPHLHLAQCLYALNLRDEALKHLQQAIEIAGTEKKYEDIKLKATTLLKHLPK